MKFESKIAAFLDTHLLFAWDAGTKQLLIGCKWVMETVGNSGLLRFHKIWESIEKCLQFVFSTVVEQVAGARTDRAGMERLPVHCPQFIRPPRLSLCPPRSALDRTATSPGGGPTGGGPTSPGGGPYTGRGGARIGRTQDWLNSWSIYFMVSQTLGRFIGLFAKLVVCRSEHRNDGWVLAEHGWHLSLVALLLGLQPPLTLRNGAPHQLLGSTADANLR